MRGPDVQQTAMFSYVGLEERIPSDHSLRPIRTMADQALRGLSSQFNELYSKEGRPSIPPERLLRALLLQALYSVRSEIQLMEQLRFNLLYRWFVGLGIDDAVWDVGVFTKNRERLLDGEIARGFFDQVLAQARAADLLSDEHFTVDGTLIEAWAGQKSFRRKDGSDQPPTDGTRNPTVNFHKQERSNQTHQSTTDPDARLYRKSKNAPALLSYLGHVLMDNRHGLNVAAALTLATGTAEPQGAQEMVRKVARARRITVGADKGYDTQGFVQALRDLNATPHVAQNTTNRKSAIDGRTTRHPGYALSQRKRKRIEEGFGWLKTVALLRKTHHRGRPLVEWMFVFRMAVYNLVRMRSLVPTG
jgi:transposase